jgi:hypothetical protein
MLFSFSSLAGSSHRNFKTLKGWYLQQEVIFILVDENNQENLNMIFFYISAHPLDSQLNSIYSLPVFQVYIINCYQNQIGPDSWLGKRPDQLPFCFDLFEGPDIHLNR